MVVDEAEFDPKRWYQILEEEKIQVWYTAPTAIRMLMRADNMQIRLMAVPENTISSPVSRKESALG